MPDEDEEKIRKMRVRIERDAYSVLLSFKDGASPRQVEQRMDDTLGYTYNSKYHLAGVYDMSQILREHPQVRQAPDGKFKIIANEDNHELVALISKQKDNKRKKGGNSGRGGRRAATSMGYHHYNRNGFGQGLTMKSSPKATNGMRPFSSMTRYNNQKPMPPLTNYSRPSTSSAPRFSVLLPKFGVPNNTANQSFTFGSTQKNYAAPSKSSAPINQFPGQRPLMRAPTASSVANCSLISLDSTCSEATLVQSTGSSIQSYPSGHLPSIKEFTENAKSMMLKLHPETIHLSEMTDLYTQEYGVSVEPLQLFSKSWMNLVKSTFKEWLQMSDGVVSLKPEWFKKYGAALKSSIALKQKPSEQVAVNPKLNKSAVIPDPNAVIPKANVSPQQFDPFSPLNDTLPSIQGFRYQPPQRKSTGISAQFNPRRPILRTPEKVQSVRKPTKTSPGLRKVPEQSIPKMEIFSSETESSSLSRLPSESVKRMLSVKPSTSDPHYDARQLRNLKYVEKPKDLINDVETALNGKADPQLNKIVKKKSKVSLRPNMSLSSKLDSIHINATPSCVSDQVRFPPSEEPSRTHSTGTLNNGMRMFGQALNAVMKQNGPKPTVPQQKLYTVPLVATPVANKNNEVTSTEKPESDDGWGIPDVPNKPLALPTVSRPILLPPMSKGSLRNKTRSRPSSICKSISSQDGIWLEKALHATLPDDDSW